MIFYGCSDEQWCMQEPERIAFHSAGAPKFEGLHSSEQFEHRKCGRVQSLH